MEQLGPGATRDDYALLSLYHFSAKMEKAAADIIEEALERWPEDPEFLTNIGISYLRANIFDKAEHWLTKAVSVSPDAPNLHDGLARLYMEKGDHKRAVHHGERALELKDSEAEARGNSGIDLDRVELKPFDASRPERNVIAFSLWGNADRYLSAAVTNARLAPHIYPGWTARFYCEEGVPDRVLTELLEAGADVIIKPPQASLYEGLFWRFGPAFDQGIDRFLIRDADSIISVRERLAVEEWLASDKHFHVMRDFLTHTDPILAGLWGGAGGCLPESMQDCFTAYLRDPGKTANCDQKFLRENVWPIARQSCLVHDSNFQVLGAKPFPGGEAISNDNIQRGHIGSSEHVRTQKGIRKLRGATSSGKLQKRERFVFLLAPSNAALELCLASPDGRPEEKEQQTLETGSAASSFLRDGNCSTVHGYWRQQAMLLGTGASPQLLVSGRDLLFSGLMENIGLFCEDAEVDIVLLHQTIAEAASTIGSREPLLPLDCERRIVNPAPLIPFGDAGHVFWHACETLTRMAFYAQRLGGLPNVTFYELDAPELENGTSAEIDRIVARFKREPTDLARRFTNSSGWLG